MREPIAARVYGEPINALRISVDPRLGRQLVRGSVPPPAILVMRHAMILADHQTAVLDAREVIGVSDGDWSNAILVVLPQPDTSARTEKEIGDMRFIEHVKRIAPALVDLATYTLSQIRAAGVDGELTEATKGRWVNGPINSFTLKVQPRVGNLHFTVYGNPNAFDAGDFLRQDQNSYSRGWIKTNSDADRMAQLVRAAHARKSR